METRGAAKMSSAVVALHTVAAEVGGHSEAGSAPTASMTETRLRERLVVARSRQLLVFLTHTSYSLPRHQRLLLAPRLMIATHLVTKFHQWAAERDLSETPAGTKAKLLRAIQAVAPRAVTEAASILLASKPSDCAAAVESLLSRINSDIKRFRPIKNPARLPAAPTLAQ